MRVIHRDENGKVHEMDLTREGLARLAIEVSDRAERREAGLPPRTLTSEEVDERVKQLFAKLEREKIKEAIYSDDQALSRLETSFPDLNHVVDKASDFIFAEYGDEWDKCTIDQLLEVVEAETSMYE